MNANELADALETMTTGWFDDLTLTQSATMLRQQQAEIEELKIIRGNSVLVPSDKLAEMQAELITLRKALNESQKN